MAPMKSMKAMKAMKAASPPEISPSQHIDVIIIFVLLSWFAQILGLFNHNLFAVSWFLGIPKGCPLSPFFFFIVK